MVQATWSGAVSTGGLVVQSGYCSIGPGKGFIQYLLIQAFFCGFPILNKEPAATIWCVWFLLGIMSKMCCCFFHLSFLVRQHQCAKEPMHRKEKQVLLCARSKRIHAGRVCLSPMSSPTRRTGWSKKMILTEHPNEIAASSMSIEPTMRQTGGGAAG